MQMAATMSRDHCQLRELLLASRSARRDFHHELSAEIERLQDLAHQQSRELLMVLGKDDSAAAAAAHKEKLRTRSSSSNISSGVGTNLPKPVGIVSGI